MRRGEPRPTAVPGGRWELVQEICERRVGAVASLRSQGAPPAVPLERPDWRGVRPHLLRKRLPALNPKAVYELSFFETNSFTAFGLAFPPVAFIT